MSKNNLIVEISNLSKNYADENNSSIEIIKNLNFKIKENSKISIIGPSGSGKQLFLILLDYWIENLMVVITSRKKIFYCVMKMKQML